MAARLTHTLKTAHPELTEGCLSKPRRYMRHTCRNHRSRVLPVPKQHRNRLPKSAPVAKIGFGSYRVCRARVGTHYEGKQLRANINKKYGMYEQETSISNHLMPFMVS